jgi:preprotein translocase subunit SecB
MTTKAESKAEPRIDLVKLYTKDLSLQLPAGTAAFRLEWQPELNFEIRTETKKLKEKDHFEVSIHLKCTNKCKDKIAFVVEVVQAGLFRLEAIQEDLLEHTLATFCPNILYPFVRETVADLVVRAGFPQLNLAAVNFEQLYQQAKAEKGTIQ